MLQVHLLVSLRCCYYKCIHFMQRVLSSLEIRTVKSFRVELVKQLIGDYNGRKRTGQATITATAKRFCWSHFPTRGSDQVHRPTTAQSSGKNVEPRCGFAKTAVYFSATMAQNRTASFFFINTMVLSARSDVLLWHILHVLLWITILHSSTQVCK